MKPPLTLLMTLLTLVPWARPVHAAPSFYTNETAFRAALTAHGFSWFGESFEETAWEASRYPGTTGNILSQGVTWYGEEHLATRSGSWNRTGDYGVYNTLGFGDGDPAPGDGLGASAADLVGIGGWFAGTETLYVSVHNESVGTLPLLRGLGTNSYQFAGLIDPAGIREVYFSGSQFGADDFTISIFRPPTTPPNVRVARLSGTTGTTLFVQGQRGRTNVVEASADLITWTAISTNVMPQTFCETCPNIYVTDSAGTNLLRRFYRARQLP